MEERNTPQSPKQPLKASTSRSRQQNLGQGERGRYSSNSSDKHQQKDNFKQDYYTDRYQDRREGYNTDQHKPYYNRDSYGYNKDRYQDKPGYQRDGYQQERKHYNNNNNYNNQDSNYKKFTHLTLRRYRNQGESLIRVHFFIRNVYVPNGDAESFIFNTRDRIQKCGDVEILQMLNHNKEQTFTDLAIGMRYDQDAKKIVDGVRVIKLLDRMGKLLNQQIEISQLFKQQILNEEKANKKRKSSNSRSRSKHNKSKKKHSYKSTPSQTPDAKEPKKKIKSKVDFDRRLFLFGIPQEFDVEDIKQTVEKKGVQILKYEWEKFNQMEYLAITVENQIQYDSLIDDEVILEKELQQNSEPINIRIPVLVMPEDKSTKIDTQLKNYQVRLEYVQDISPVTLYQMFKKHGTIVNLFQDQHSLQIIYSKPYTKLELKIPQTLNILQTDPFIEMEIKIQNATQTEVIERQPLNKTIQYQIQLLQQQQLKQKIDENTGASTGLTAANNNVPPKVSDQSSDSKSSSRSRSGSKSYSQRSGSRSQSKSRSRSRNRSLRKSKSNHRSISPRNNNVFKRGEGGQFVKSHGENRYNDRSNSYDNRRFNYRNNNKPYYNRQDQGDYNNRNNFRRQGQQGNYNNNNRQGGGTNYGKNFNNYNDKDYNYSGRNFNNNKGYNQQGGYDRNNNNNRNYNNNNNRGGHQDYNNRY